MKREAVAREGVDLFERGEKRVRSRRRFGNFNAATEKLVRQDSFDKFHSLRFSATCFDKKNRKL